MPKRLLALVAVCTIYCSVPDRASALIPTFDVANMVQNTITSIETTASSLTAVQQLMQLLKQLAQLQALYNQGTQLYDNVGSFVDRIKGFFSGSNGFLNPLTGMWNEVKRGDFIDLNNQLGISNNVDPNNPIAKINANVFGPLNWQMNNLNQTMDLLSNYNAGTFLRNVFRGAQSQAAANAGATAGTGHAQVNNNGALYDPGYEDDAEVWSASKAMADHINSNIQADQRADVASSKFSSELASKMTSAKNTDADARALQLSQSSAAYGMQVQQLKATLSASTAQDRANEALLHMAHSEEASRRAAEAVDRLTSDPNLY